MQGESRREASEQARRQSKKAKQSAALKDSGDDSKRAPPVPIPNTEVKPLSAEGTWLATAREIRTPPGTTSRSRKTSAFSLPFPFDSKRDSIVNDKTHLTFSKLSSSRFLWECSCLITHKAAAEAQKGYSIQKMSLAHRFTTAMRPSRQAQKPSPSGEGGRQSRPDEVLSR